jgi:hypothetical protein
MGACSLPPGGGGGPRDAGRREGPVRAACRGLGGCLLAPGRAPPQCFGAEQDQPVDEQQDSCGGGLGEQDTEGVLERHAGQADRDRGEDDQPGEPLILALACANVVSLSDI